MFKEQDKTTTCDVKDTNPNRRHDIREWLVFGRRKVETTDNTALRQVFDKPDVLRYGEIGVNKMNGRIETYVHSDSMTQNKGAVIVKITCETDFAAKTQEFIEFCKMTARLCYAMETNGPSDFVSCLMEIDPEYKTKLEDLEKKLKEKIDILDVFKMTL